MVSPFLLPMTFSPYTTVIMHRGGGATPLRLSIWSLTTVLINSSAKIYAFIRCHPPDGVTGGPPPSLSDTTESSASGSSSRSGNFWMILHFIQQTSFSFGRGRHEQNRSLSNDTLCYLNECFYAANAQQLGLRNFDNSVLVEGPKLFECSC